MATHSTELCYRRTTSLGVLNNESKQTQVMITTKLSTIIYEFNEFSEIRGELSPHVHTICGSSPIADDVSHDLSRTPVYAARLCLEMFNQNLAITSKGRILYLRWLGVWADIRQPLELDGNAITRDRMFV